METAATPVSSPVSTAKSRKSLLRQNLNASLNASAFLEERVLSPASNCAENMTERELKLQHRHRRSFRADDLLASTHIPNKEQLEVVARPNMTDRELIDHYQSCIQMVSAGKVSTKNAFSLHLIDVMTQVLSTCNRDTFFQMAGCTLDAGAKIYSYRVDGLHNDAYRVANILGGGKDKREEADGEDVVEMESEADIPIRLKKKKKNFKCIVEDTSKIFKHVTYNVEYDAIGQKVASLIDTSNFDPVCLNLPIGDGENRMERIVTNGREPISFKPNHPDVTTFPLIPKESLNLPSSEDVKKKMLYRPVDEIFKLFEDVWNAREEKESIDNSRIDKFLTDIHNNFVFDPDAPPAQDEDLAFDADDYTIGFDPAGKHVEETFGVAHQTHSASSKTEFDILGNSNFSVLEPSLENLLKFVQPGDFTNFSEPVLNAFFGTRAKAKQRLASKEPAVVKKKTKITPDTLLIEYTTGASLASCKSRSATTLLDSRLDSKANTTATYSRVEYLRSQWTSYFELELNLVRSHKEDRSAKQQMEGVEVGEGYDYNNALDTSHAAVHLRDDDYDDLRCDPRNEDDLDDEVMFENIHNEDENYDIEEMGLERADNERGDHAALVDQPLYTEKFRLNYAKRAKVVDVRKVKKCMLATLRNHERDEQTRKETEESCASLVELFHQAHARLPPSAVRDLSIPMAFVALLDLANEQSLKLKQDPLAKNVFVDF